MVIGVRMLKSFGLNFKKRKTKNLVMSCWMREVMILLTKYGFSRLTLVFKAYGYLLPGIIISLLLATGPKAFLITMAIALSLSAISLAFENIRGSVSKNPRTRARANKKKNPFSKNSSQRQEKKKRNSKYTERNGYKSWISSMNAEEDVESGLGRNNFGGWDELYNEEDSAKKAPPMQSKKRTKEENVSWKGKSRDDEPMFLRLLIAVFPFLRSWTMML